MAAPDLRNEDCGRSSDQGVEQEVGELRRANAILEADELELAALSWGVHWFNHDGLHSHRDGLARLGFRATVRPVGYILAS